MSKYLLMILIVASVVMTGCINAKKYGRQAADGALEAVESRLVQLEGKQARDHISNAMREGFAEIDVDPNLDGRISHEEFFSFQGKVQAFILQDAFEGFQSGKTFGEIKERAIGLEKTFGISGILAAPAMLALNTIRNKTRKKQMDEISESNGKTV